MHQLGIFTKKTTYLRNSDIGLMGRPHAVSLYNNYSSQKKKNFWDNLEDSFNDSVPRIKEKFGSEASPEMIKRTSDSKAFVQNILDEEDSILTNILNKIYLAPWWPYFYLAITIIWVWFVFLVLFKGKEITKTVLFKMFELLMNIFLVVDISCKIYLIGWNGYFKQVGNIIEFIIGFIWIFLYAVFWLISSIRFDFYDEMIEDFIFIGWWIWQVFRIASLFLNQRRSTLVQEDKISFEQFHDEIDNQSFMGRPSRSKSAIENTPTPVKNDQKYGNFIFLKIFINFKH